MRAGGHNAMRTAVVLSALLLGACAHNSPYEPNDPLESINRPIYAFNMTADKYVLRPVAKGYVAAVPSPIRTGIGNFIDNFFYPRVILHDLLQGKFAQAGQDTGRLLLNSTFGLAGFLDPATIVGWEKNDEDLGQTLGRWGVGDGWYLMLPFFGPSSNRDLVGMVGDNWTEPLQYLENVEFRDRVIITGVTAIDSRAGLLDLDSILEQQLDPYVFMRTAYLQKRLNEVYDGNPPLELTEPPLPE